MAEPAFSLAVYCGSRTGNDPQFAEAARMVGHWIGSHGGQLVYGGGRNGLMGTVADATQAAGGRVVGVIPHGLATLEHARETCDELHVVQTMHERKALMADRSDAFLALPGGIGTFEEFFEVWTWRQLGYHQKPIGLLNVAGYYDALLAFVQTSTDQDFMRPWQLDLVQTSHDWASLLRNLVQAAGCRANGVNLESVL